MTDPLDPLATAAPAAPTLDPAGSPGHPEAAAPTLDPAARLGEIRLAGRHFGDFELLEEVARGGMGVVFRARQKSIDRIVAVKMILAGHLASPEQVRRFHAEAEEAGRMDHPNVVPIYQVGEQDGQHYFAMKLIEGGCLTDKIANLVGRPAAAAGLVAAVARAVHYAHERGILHRDIKPGNILLDRDGHPHVTDFGVAKHLEGGASGTQTGSIVGTPSYMAPEQAAARKDLTTAADVYALGAVLYELLTGRPPFLAATQLETLIHVTERDPVRPRTIRPDIPRDLETVCLTCLAKDPARRYPSAAALAADLDRAVAGEPIHARPVGRLERARLWARRRPAQAALVAVSGLAVVALAAGGWWHNRSLVRALDVAEAARHDAELSEAEAHRQKAQAAANFQKARDAVDGLLTRVVEGRLSHMRGMESVRLEFLRDAQQFYDGFLRERSADPAIRQEAARAYRRIGDVSRLAKAYPKGEEAYRRAVELQAALVADYPTDSAYRDDLAVTYRNLGRLHKAANRPPAALAAFRESVAVRAPIVSPDQPRADEYRQRQAQTLFDQAGVLKQTEAPADAEAAYRRALDLQEALVAAHPDGPAYAAELGDTAHELAGLCAERGNPAEAKRLLDRATVVDRTAVRLDPTNTGYRQSQKTRAARRMALLRDQRDHAGLARAADEWRADFADSPADVYAAACQLAAAATLAAADPAAKGYADRAATTLAAAVAQGYSDRGRISREPDLATLRERSDVRAVLADLERRVPDTGLTPGREYFALLGEFQAAQQAFFNDITQARTAEDRVKVMAKAPNPAAFVGRFMDLANRAPDDPAAIDAIVWVLSNEPPTTVREKALDLLTKDHVADAKMLTVCPLLTSATGASGRLLTALAEKSPHRDVRAHAIFMQATAVKKQADSAATRKQTNAAALATKAEGLFDRVLTEYADVRKPPTSTLGAAAKVELNEMRNLWVGKPAPEIEGTDLDGRRFKLSDYRGKVVVLDFWADWCPYCKQMYPDQRATMKRLAEQPFVMLGVNADEDLDELKKLVVKEELTWRSWFDGGPKGARIRRQYNVTSLPRTFILDNKGVIRYRHIGTLKGSDMDKVVNGLLAEIAAEQSGGK